MKPSEARSRWECPKCGLVYESPITGTLAVGHLCPNVEPQLRAASHTTEFKKVWGK